MHFPFQFLSISARNLWVFLFQSVLSKRIFRGCDMNFVLVGRSLTALSGSVLYSARVLWYNASGPMPHMKSSCIFVFFLVQPFCPTTVCVGHIRRKTNLYTEAMARKIPAIYKSLIYCRNLSSHCFGVKIRFPSDVASKLGTSIWFVSIVIFFVSVKFNE